ncbi:MAG TPA: cytochrome b N-terminal domain-containing protein [Kribbellaceae bacterium]|jgi:quinol-cytochrome oxidoreductase complex cytochrome b subunit
MADVVKQPPYGKPLAARRSLVDVVEDQFALRQLISEYLVPIETNVVWYTLGGVLMLALAVEIATGVLLSLVYDADAGRAYGVTRDLIAAPGWSVVINFHYWNSFLIFGLVMVHMMRVFVTGGYRGPGTRGGKQGLWLGGVILAGCVFLAALTGETLHWDEVGFAVPWHISEFFQALGLATAVHYTFAELRYIPTATFKLGQIYALHISIVPIVLGLFLALHYYLIKVKGVSMPFWRSASGRTAPFSSHMREWVIYGGIILGIVLVVSIFAPRDPGVAPQLLPTSPFFGSTHGPGALGTKPTFPIGWTHGMNVFFGERLGIDPDIWGTVVGMLLMLGALLAVPWLDRAEREPRGWREAFDLRQRGWAFAAVALFWLVMVVGSVQNFIAVPE